MASSNNILLMSIEDDSSYGQKDICVSFFFRAMATGQSPANIGDDINTISDEYSPVPCF
jgi:hypothetical protein